MGIKTKLGVSVLLAQLLAGCTMPGLQIREVYWGKEFLERTLFQRTVTHDARGNPVLAQPGPLFGPAPEPDPDLEEEEEP